MMPGEVFAQLLQLGREGALLVERLLLLPRRKRVVSLERLEAFVGNGEAMAGEGDEGVQHLAAESGRVQPRAPLPGRERQLPVDGRLAAALRVAAEVLFEEGLGKVLAQRPVPQYRHCVREQVLPIGDRDAGGGLDGGDEVEGVARLVEQNAVAALPLADRVYLLEAGAIVAEDVASAFGRDDKIRQAYLGV